MLGVLFYLTLAQLFYLVGNLFFKLHTCWLTAEGVLFAGDLILWP